MTDFEFTRTITGDAFVTTANTLLNEAADTATALEEAISNAKKVCDTLGEIASGSVILDPRPAESEMTLIGDRANLILSISSKSKEALDRSEARRQHTIKQTEQPGKTTYTGTGSAAKS